MNKPASAFPTVFLAIAVVTLTACSREQTEAPASRELVRNVALTSATRGPIPDYLEAAGTVRAAQSVQVASQMMGNLVEVRVHEGEHVTRGQVLAVIDDAQPRAGLDRAAAAQEAAQQETTAADSDLRLAEATFGRYQDLYQKKSVSPQELDEVKARFQAAQAHRDSSRAAQTQAQAALESARTALQYSRVRAPFDGVITEKKADPGSLAAPGMPLFTVEDPRRYRIEITVDESDIGRLRVGQQLQVRIDALSADVAGKVAQIVPAADPASRSFLVKADLPPDPRLRSGLFGRARIPHGEKNAVRVLRSAVLQRGQLQAVYVLDAAQVASLRYITLGNSFDDQVEVLSGLDGGERLVNSPAALDLGGKRIEGR